MSTGTIRYNRSTASIIKIIGVGGGGSNAVNHMFTAGIKDVVFVICNTDIQALKSSPVPVKIQLGVSLTQGLGAGNKPERGKSSAMENLNEIEALLSEDTKMVFITAGMGGGTGTGAAPVIAKAAHDLDILTVGIVTLPFRFEGQRRINQAIQGISEMKNYVDSLLVINNEKLREIHGDLKISEAFANADDILTVAAKGIAEIITVQGYVNVDFADVRTVMKNSGVAIMGSGQANGSDRSVRAVQSALTSPLLDNNDISGSKNVLIHISSGTDEITMDEVGIITEYVQELAGRKTNIIWGNSTDFSLGSNVAVTVIATGFSSEVIPELYIMEKQYKSVFDLGRSGSGNSTKTGTSNEKKTPPASEVNSQCSPVKTSFTETDKPKSVVYTSVFSQEKPSVQDTTYKKPLLKQDDTTDYKKSIKDIETIPAYIRRKMKLNDQLEESEKNTQLSGKSLVDTDDGNVAIRDNAFLNKDID